MMRYSILLPILFLIALCWTTLSGAQAAEATPAESKADVAPSSTSVAIANAFAGLIEQAIPREYDKRKNWGNTKRITVGIRMDGIKIYRRKKTVKHGVWKHYKIKLVEPDKRLRVHIENLRSLENGRVGFTMRLQVKFNIWARAKIYKYGVHLIALETVGDAEIDLALDCEVGVNFQTQSGDAGVALDPLVTGARLDITDFHLRRVSNAKGPIIRELGEELPRLIERELQGPKLVSKLNRAINKKRDRLELSFSELIGKSSKKK